MAAVLIGGAGRRMGSPKSMLQTGGKFVLERIVDAVCAVEAKPVLVGAGQIPPCLSGLTRLTDATETVGPLAGILSALRELPTARWLVLSCDLPLVTPAALCWLLARDEPSAPAVLPHLDKPDKPDEPEPLLAIYGPAALELIEEAARRGERSPRRILREAGIVSPRVPAHLREAWTNVNTPEEWQAAAAILSEREQLRRKES